MRDAVLVLVLIKGLRDAVFVLRCTAWGFDALHGGLRDGVLVLVERCSGDQRFEGCSAQHGR